MFGHPVEVIHGKGYIEVKLRGINKGNAVWKILGKITALHGRPDFVLCIGDDRSDESMFEVVSQYKGSTPVWKNIEIRVLRGGGVSVEIIGFVPWTPKYSKARASSGASGASPPSDAGAAGAGGLGAGGLSSLSSFSSLGHAHGQGFGSGGGCGGTNSPSGSPLHQGGLGGFFSCTVGQKPSKAGYYLNDVEEVSELLFSLGGVVHPTLRAARSTLSSANLKRFVRKS